MRLFILANVFFIASCSSRESIDLSDSEKRQITAEVNQTLHNYFSDIREKGMLAEFAYLDSSKNFFWVPPGYSSPLFFDSAAVVIRANARVYQKTDNVWEALAIMPLTKELANYTGRIKSTMVDTAGNVLNFKLAETGILIRRKSGWKLLSGQTSLLETRRKFGSTKVLNPAIDLFPPVFFSKSPG